MLPISVREHFRRRLASVRLFRRPLRMTVTGKLCRNSSSTIKLPQEDGGSKAVWMAMRVVERASPTQAHTPFDAPSWRDHNSGFVAARTGAVYSEGLGRVCDS